MAFSDLLSSSRGPGIIGTMVAGVVLGGFGLLFFLCFDEGMQGKSVSIQSEIRKADESIASSQREIANRQANLELLPQREADDREATQLKAANALAAKNITDTEAERDAATQDVKDAEKALADYKDGYRAAERRRAVGEIVPELKTNDGKVYENARITLIDPVGMQITHSGGSKRIEYKLLPDALQDRFQFDEVQKDQTVNIENLNGEGLKTSVELTGLQTNLERRQKDLNELQSQIERDSRDATALRLSVDNMKAAVTRKRVEISAEEKKGISKAPAMRVELQKMEANYNAALAQINPKELAIKENRNKLPEIQSQIAQIKRDITRVKASAATAAQ